MTKISGFIKCTSITLTHKHLTAAKETILEDKEYTVIVHKKKSILKNSSAYGYIFNMTGL